MRVDRLTSDPGDVTLAYRRAVVPAAPPVPAAVPAQRDGDAVRAADEAERSATAEGDRRPAPPPVPYLSAGDRAAVASVTGYYLSPGGEVTPEGNPPWSFIIQYVAQRRADRTDPSGGGAAPDAAEGTGLDVIA